MDPIATASYGMFAATRRFEASAQRVATMGAPDAQVSYEKEAVEQISAKYQFKANLATIETAREMWDALLKIQERR